MRRTSIIPLLLIVAAAGCMGGRGLKEQRVQTTRPQASDSSLHADDRRNLLKNADRCTACHLVWTWENGSYRDGDRHGFISDYTRRPPIGYKDPWGLDIPSNPFREYYYTDWWKGPWLEEKTELNPEMSLDGYGPVNEGRSKPGDFKGTVIVVDPSGKGDVRTVQEGVNRAPRGATVFVRPGTYRESVRLKEGVRLWGAGPMNTTLDGGGQESAIVAVNACDISGFTITNSGGDPARGVFTAGIRVLDCDASLVIRGNIFAGDTAFGVLVESSRNGGTPRDPIERTILPEHALRPLEFSGYAAPRIIGNTFTMMTVRAIHCIHASPEIANNLFIGSLKPVGMTQLSRPFIHHNVFYRNGIPITVDRSMPVVAYNIMIRSAWGQRVSEGSRPVIHHNITWDSPWFREFGEDGRPIPLVPFPGTGEQAVNPALVSPEKGDYRITASSPIKRLSNTKSGYGLIKGYGVQYPPTLPCTASRVDLFISRSDTTRTILAEIDRQNARIKSLELAYTIEYRSFLETKYDRSGNQVSGRLVQEPVSGTDYRARVFHSLDKRQKSYSMHTFAGGKSIADSGTVFFDGERVRAPGGYFKTDSRLIGDIRQVGARPTRENIGGIFLDYDQYLNGAIGPGGTFYSGYLRILGGSAAPRKEKVDGRECIVIRYPHIGTDQYYTFYLDPGLGYRPRKLEQYFGGRIYRRIDGYRYETVGGVSLPVAATVTDYAVSGSHTGAVIGQGILAADPATIRVNGKAK